MTSLLTSIFIFKFSSIVLPVTVKALILSFLSLINSFMMAGIPPALKKPSIRCSPAGWQFANKGMLCPNFSHWSKLKSTPICLAIAVR